MHAPIKTSKNENNIIVPIHPYMFHVQNPNIIISIVIPIAKHAHPKFTKFSAIFFIFFHYIKPNIEHKDKININVKKLIRPLLM